MYGHAGALAAMGQVGDHLVLCVDETHDSSNRRGTLDHRFALPVDGH
jgi:hypothetical protein